MDEAKLRQGLGDNVSRWLVLDVEVGRVVEVYWYEQGLMGSIPAAIGELGALQELHLDSNYNINGHLPPEIGKLPNLNELDLSYNRFKGCFPPR